MSSKILLMSISLIAATNLYAVTSTDPNSPVNTPYPEASSQQSNPAATNAPRSFVPNQAVNSNTNPTGPAGNSMNNPSNPSSNSSTNAGLNPSSQNSDNTVNQNRDPAMNNGAMINPQ